MQTRPSTEETMESTQMPDNGREKMSILKRVSNGFISILESAFYKLGWVVGSHPVWTIFVCILVSGLCSIGMKDLQPTSEAEKLWVPAASRVQWEKKWVSKHFPPVTRYSSIIVTSDNILTPESLQAMMGIFKKAEALQINGHNFTTMCFRVGPLCRVTSILELWYNNEHLIKSLTQEDIVDRVNNVTHSPLYHGELDVTSFLGRIQKDNQGRIVRAQAASMLFLLMDKKEWRDAAMEWELDMVDIANKGQEGLQHVYIYTTRSLDDEVKGAVNSDFGLLSMGFSIVLIYLILTLGRFNLLEQKLYLSLAGLFSVGMAIGLAYGLAITCGVLYGPVHGMMPFLLLGIGVDDMFVIVESWKNLTPQEEKYPLPERMALTLKHAGVSVTVTSITDVVAFAIGASTVIPGLSAFCTYAAIGILALYALQSTFFVACLTLDQMRQEASRDGCIVCYKHKDYVPNKCSQRNIMAFIFEKYLGPNLMKLPCKLLAILITCVILGVNIWGFISLRQDFDLTDYIPSDSYAHAYADARENYFPSDGETVNVYCGDMFYHENMDKLNKMYDDINKDPYVVNGSVTFWLRSFNSWYDSIKDEDWVKPYLDKKTNYIGSRAMFSRLMWKFLYYTDIGQAYRHYAYFKNGTVIPELEGTYFSLRHTNQRNSKAEIVAMESLRKILDNTDFTPKCFSYTDVYLTYEANKVLQNELYRNLLLAGICVFVVTLLLIANIRTSLIVFTCVIFTVVDVAGTLYFWKVTIDTASSILLTLSVGLAVDYSAHVGHMFMTVSGTREERAVLTLKKIGPAVFSGGFSTFLAFVLLSRSYSYGFIVFFRVFVSVVIFGLFHGLIYLPVVLSWIGPDPYETQAYGNRKHLYVPDCNFTNGGHLNDNIECDDNKTNKDGNPSSPWVLGNATMMDHMPLQEEQVPDHKTNSPLLNSLRKSATSLLGNKQQVTVQDIPHSQSDPSGNKYKGSSPQIQSDPLGDKYKESSPLDQTGSGEEQPFLPQAEKLESPWVFQGRVATSMPIFKFSNTDKTVKTLSKELEGSTDHCRQDIHSLTTEKDSISGITENGNFSHQEIGLLGNGSVHRQEGPTAATNMEKAKKPSSPWELRDTVFTSEDVKLLDRSSKSLTER